MDYPNFFDRLDRKTGDGIWLHAVPDDVPLTRGSRGCVVVRNQVIKDLTRFVRLGQTPIIIEDIGHWVSRDEHTSMATRSQEWLEDWRSAWMEKRIDAYIDHYDESFESLGMNRSQWRSFKDRLNRTYQTIDVRLSRPKFLVHGNRAVVRFLQQYQSDQVQDFGEKTLYLRRRSPQGPWKIVSEQWQKETDPQAIAEMAKTVAAHQGR
jgi:murein L,D-transpeptidase YafK